MAVRAAAQAVLLHGNEAIARGAWESGVRVATGYPGTPSTEIIEALASYQDIYVEWSSNEKVALEVAIGACLGGARAIACMKHVGVNVAADPLMTVAYMGVNAGLVLVTADDPGMHSSQNEQDNRWYGKFARLPVLEPSDSREAKEYTAAAFGVSEEFDTPVILRTTTRISHARSPVELGERVCPPDRPYRRDPLKNVMLPGHARMRKPLTENRLQYLTRFAETTPLNRLEWPKGHDEGRAPRGFVTGGVAYQYVREAFPEAPVFKLGLSYPLPANALRDFAGRVDTLYVVEELDPFWEAELKYQGIEAVGKQVFSKHGELTASLVRQGVAEWETERAGLSGAPLLQADEAGVDGSAPTAALPVRPPVLCPGCPHRAVFHVLRKLRLTVTGDIGCYTLGALPPLSAMDTCTCMGASIGGSIGMRRALPPEQAERVVAVIGDSTFVHSGITALIDAVYNRTPIVLLILDNETTAMTGHQGHPAAGWNARGEESPRVSLEALVSACGVTRLAVVDPGDMKALEGAVKSSLVPGDGPAVLIVRRPCVLLPRSRRAAAAVSFASELCTECGACFRIGCPALGRDGKRPQVQAELCIDCGQCAAVCPSGALGGPKEEERDPR
ncbi:MAG: indolepyruvate ferredoxin oxidoreductase subunit alpha [Bacillota bacterium]|nr:indolepyruvate ferredoxin oxidoreductase subunit alpha [Bacillota bacterium]